MWCVRGHLPSLANVNARFASNYNIFVHTKRTKIVATQHVSPAQNASVAGAPPWVCGSLQRPCRSSSWIERGRFAAESVGERIAEVWRGKGGVDFAPPPCKKFLWAPMLCIHLILLMLSVHHFRPDYSHLSLIYSFSWHIKLTCFIKPIADNHSTTSMDFTLYSDFISCIHLFFPALFLCLKLSDYPSAFERT